MDLLNNPRALAFAAGVAVVALGLATMVRGALAVAEPPLEAAGGQGLRIRLVEPPKPALIPGGRLEVGASSLDQVVSTPVQSLSSRAPAPRARDSDFGADGASDPAMRDEHDERADERSRFDLSQDAWPDGGARGASHRAASDDRAPYVSAEPPRWRRDEPEIRADEEPYGPPAEAVEPQSQQP